MTDPVVRGIPAELRDPPPDPDPVDLDVEPESGPGSMAAPIVDDEIGDPEQVNARCPHCGAPVSSAEAFCEACGSDLASGGLNPLDQPAEPADQTAVAVGAPIVAPEAPPIGAPLGAPADTPVGVPAGVPPVSPSPEAVSAADLDLHDLAGPGESSEETHRRPAPPNEPIDQGFGPVNRVCAECGGRVADDLYCEQCGTKAQSQRDHFTEAPTDWVAGVCDRGIRHHRNEDAMALDARGDGAGPDLLGHAVLVVCDGVSTSTDSDLASLAAARAARQVLVTARPTGLGVESSRNAALAQTMAVAAAEANAAVVRSSAGRAVVNDNPASCTFAVAVIDGAQIACANIGDSRVYWMPDDAEPVMLSIDDSVAQTRISMGMPREQAENSPQAHAITRWLGPDAPDLKPTMGSMTATGPGWVMVCSDGLWNYASEATRLAELMAEAIATDPANAQPLALAATLTQWANDQGGKDNITVALARLGPPVAVVAPEPGVPTSPDHPTPQD